MIQGFRCSLCVMQQEDDLDVQSNMGNDQKENTHHHPKSTHSNM